MNTERRNWKALGFSLMLLLFLALCGTVQAATEISSIAVTVKAPSIGQAPTFTASAGGTGYAVYEYTSDSFPAAMTYKNGVYWWDKTDDIDNSFEKYEAGHVYFVRILVKTTSNDYTFSSDCTATINGKEASINTNVFKNKEDHYLAVQMEFYTLTNIGTVKVYNIDLPKSGLCPDYDADTDSEQYGFYSYTNAAAGWHNGIYWYDTTDRKVLAEDDTFTGGHEYQLAVILKAKDGNLFKNDGTKPTVTAWLVNNGTQQSLETYNGMSNTQGGYALYAGLRKIFTASYHVVFDSAGGTAVPDQYVAPGQTAKFSSNPTKENLNFQGWYLDKAFTETFTSATKIYQDTTLYAKWGGQISIYSYDQTAKATYRGGKFTINGGEEKDWWNPSFTEGDQLALKAIPAENYRFAGWKDITADVLLSTEAEFAYTPVGKHTIYAVFEKIPISEVKVTFDETEDSVIGTGDRLNDDSDRYSATIHTFTDAEGVTVSSGGVRLEPRKSYSVHIYFSVYGSDLFADSVTVTVNGNPVTVQNMAEDKTSFEADYSFTLPPSAVIYTVSFDPGGGSGTMEPVQVHRYDRITAPECTFTPPEDMVFSKWATGYGWLEAGEEYGPSSDMTWTAEWKNAPLKEIGITFSEAAGDTLQESSPQKSGKRQNYWLNVLKITGPDGEGSTTLKESAQYSVTLSFSTEWGYVFDADPALTVNGNTVPIKAMNTEKNYCEAEYTFTVKPKTEWIVEFMANGGDGTMERLFVPMGSSFTVPECGYTWKWFELAYWEVLDLGTWEHLKNADDQYLNLQSGDSYTPDRDIMLRAQWKALPRTPIEGTLSATVVAPKAGEHPKPSEEAGVSADAAKYTVSVDYYDLKFASYCMNTSDVFEDGGSYRIYVFFIPTEEYEVPEDAPAKINGQSADFWTHGGSDRSICYYVDVRVGRVPGDADVNGTVDMQDALLVLQYCGGQTVTINLENADVNEDGTVNMKDAMLILQYDCGWDVVLK